MVSRIRHRLFQPSRSDRAPRQIERAFRELLDAGVELRPTGKTRNRPARLLSLGYAPKHAIELFDTTFYLTNVRENFYVRFFVAYVVQPTRGRCQDRTSAILLQRRRAQLAFGVAHRASARRFLDRKGDVETVIQTVRSTSLARVDYRSADRNAARTRSALPEGEDDSDRRRRGELILRTAPGDASSRTRLQRAASARQSEPRNLVNGGRSVAWFARKNDPTSLRFARGFEPDLDAGSWRQRNHEPSLWRSGPLLPILSRNRRIQYLFMGAPRHVWIIPPQR